MITLDVQRSYTNIDAMDQSTLKNILRTYSFYNSEIMYCQGMNFLAAFLYLFFNDEEKTFKAFVGLVDKLEMGDLFK